MDIFQIFDENGELRWLGGGSLPPAFLGLPAIKSRTRDLIYMQSTVLDHVRGDLFWGTSFSIEPYFSNLVKFRASIIAFLDIWRLCTGTNKDPGVEA